VDEEIRAYYETGVERDRLTEGYSRVEFERTKEILGRYLPSEPARVLDVGGGPGAYAEWLAEQGHVVRLVDAASLHVDQALERAQGRFSAVLGDARALDEADGSYDIVLLLGPLYHLVEREERLTALLEARRVLRPGGLVAAAAISRFASLLDGLFNQYLDHPEFWSIVERDLADGQHRSATGYFTTAFFHHPDELVDEVESAGFSLDGLFGVEGPGWLRIDRAESYDDILRVARAVEREPSVIGASSHLLAIGRKD
jgi:ubiquinone/menaquinone biosynthesis C-methylase UbiE